MAIKRKEPTDLTDGKWLETDQYFEASNVVNTTDSGEHLELSYAKPDSITGLNLWLKADSLDLNDNDAVGTWADDSGNDNDATQGTAANKPTFKTNILNGKPVVRFDGSNDWLSIGNDVFDGISSEVSVFIVASSASATKNTSCFVALPDDAGNRFNCHLPWGNGTLYWDFGDIGSNGRISKAWGGTTNTHYIWTLLAGSGMQIKRDGTSLETSANSSTFTPGTKTLRFGYYDGSVYWGGDIAEIIIYNKRLSTAEIAIIEGYLSQKYGIATIEKKYEDNGYRVSNPLSLNSIKKVKSSNIKWTSTEPTNTDIKIYTAVSSSNTTEPGFFLSGWDYRKKVTITGQTGAGTGYQVLLKIGESSGSSGYDFHLGGHSSSFPSGKGNGGDLRFTDDDGITLLPFWVEKVEGTASNRVAYVWVKVADDLGSNVNIYCYYGNSSATNGSNGDNTFLFFDDFDGDSLDTDKWITTDDGTGSRSFSNSVITQTGNTGKRTISPKNTISGRIAIESLIKVNGARRSLETINLVKDENNIGPNIFYEAAAPGGFCTSPMIGGSWQTLYQLENSDGANQWRIVHGDNRGTTTVAEIFNSSRGSIGSKSWSLDIGTTFTIDPVGARYVSASSTLEMDWYLIRKYQTTEPSFNTAGSEETKSSVVNYTEATSNSTIPGISTNQDLTGKYLWIMQKLSTTIDDTPTLSTLEVLIEGAKKSSFFQFF